MKCNQNSCQIEYNKFAKIAGKKVVFFSIGKSVQNISKKILSVHSTFSGIIFLEKNNLKPCCFFVSFFPSESSVQCLFRSSNNGFSIEFLSNHLGKKRWIFFTVLIQCCFLFLSGIFNKFLYRVFFPFSEMFFKLTRFDWFISSPQNKSIQTNLLVFNVKQENFCESTNSLIVALI